MKTRLKHASLLHLGFVLVTSSSACVASAPSGASGGEEHSERVAQATAALTSADAGTTASGYGTCKELACTDVARGCDDIIRAGCGAAFLMGKDRVMPSVPQCSATYDEALARPKTPLWTSFAPPSRSPDRFHCVESSDRAVPNALPMGKVTIAPRQPENPALDFLRAARPKIPLWTSFALTAATHWPKFQRRMSWPRASSKSTRPTPNHHIRRRPRSARRFGETGPERKSRVD